MRGSGPSFLRILRSALIVLAAAMGLLCLSAAAPSAFAQEDGARPWSLKDILYPKREQIQRGARERVPATAPDAPSPPQAMPAERAKPKAAPARAAPQPKAVPDKPPRKAAVAKATQPDPAPTYIEKAADAKVVLVVGDFIAGAAAEGLDRLFAQNSKVKIVDRTSGASGLVRNDHYDWPARIGALIAQEKPDVVLMAVGANDRQAMRIGAARETLRSGPWLREYTARAASFASEVASLKVPLVWLGTPSFKSARMNADMLAFNEIYRNVAADGGIEFVEVWDGFVDEAGKFVTTGPDVTGQPVRLRTEDGINLTTAGKQKLAFYSEKELRRLLGLAAAPASGQGTETTPTPGPLPGHPTVDRTAPIALGDPTLDGGETLLGATLTREAARPAIPVAAVPGRVDDFALHGRPPASAAPDGETTSAVSGTPIRATQASSGQ